MRITDDHQAMDSIILLKRLGYSKDEIVQGLEFWNELSLPGPPASGEPLRIVCIPQKED